jgi:hypothetical protein
MPSFDIILHHHKNAVIYSHRLAAAGSETPGRTSASAAGKILNFRGVAAKNAKVAIARKTPPPGGVSSSPTAAGRRRRWAGRKNFAYLYSALAES